MMQNDLFTTIIWDVYDNNKKLIRQCGIPTSVPEITDKGISLQCTISIPYIVFK